MRAPKPLVVRAGLSRTFGSIAGFAALGLLSLGIYLLADAFSHPVDAEAAGVIVAAFAIAMAITRGERLRSDLPFQCTFVDHSRIRPRTLPRLKRAELLGNSSLPESYDGESDALR